MERVTAMSQLLDKLTSDFCASRQKLTGDLQVSTEKRTTELQAAAQQQTTELQIAAHKLTTDLQTAAQRLTRELAASTKIVTTELAATTKTAADELDNTTKQLVAQMREELAKEIGHVRFAAAKLEKERDALSKEKALLAERFKIDSPVVRLNVGGRPFDTTLSYAFYAARCCPLLPKILRSTLCKHPGSMLEAMFSGRHQVAKDEKGRFFIDRNPDLFADLLEWLRTGDTTALRTPKHDIELDYFMLLERTLRARDADAA